MSVRGPKDRETKNKVGGSSQLSEETRPKKDVALILIYALVAIGTMFVAYRIAVSFLLG